MAMQTTIYRDIAARTGGDIYIGVVGPVRTGKSTVVKRIMEELVIPNIEDAYRRERAKDELPQSGSGRTIMTAEPKFVPEEAVEISPDGTARLRIRMIDTVGYMVEGASGAMEDGKPRMIVTPWADEEIPMTQAAELGTRKVMEDHCSVGLVVITDGTVTDIPRADYAEAEQRAIADMQATGKPFLVLVNSAAPEEPAARGLCESIRRQTGAVCVAADGLHLRQEEVAELLGALLYAFPMGELQVRLPRWMDALEADHPVKASLYEALMHRAEEIGTLGGAETALARLQELDQVTGCRICAVDPGTGTVCCSLEFPEQLYYEILSSRTGFEISGEGALMELLTELADVKREYDKIAGAMEEVRATGYGVVLPTPEEMRLEAPEVVRKGGAYGVKLRAGASSIHMLRVDVDTEISPMVGDEKQSENMISYLVGEYEESPEKLWSSNIFGKSVFEMVNDGMSAKLTRMPAEVRGKFRGALTRIVNEGGNGLICIIL